MENDANTPQSSDPGTALAEVEPSEQLTAHAAADLPEQDSVPEAPPLHPTVIVMHASVGSGHRSAANATAQALEILRDTDDPELLQGLTVPEDLEIEVLDILEFGRHVFDGDHAASLFTGATRPLYDLTWRYTLTGRLLWGGGTI